MNTKVRRLTVTGLLGAITVVLAASPIGRIPLPWTPIVVTTMHLPAIIGGVLEGPTVGAGVGLFFGLWSFLNPSAPFFSDPLVSILPRLFIGVVAALVFRATKSPEWAAAAGTATNTLGVLGMLGLRSYLPWKVVAGIAVTNGLPEIILAVAVVSLFYRKVRGMLPAAR